MRKLNDVRKEMIKGLKNRFIKYHPEEAKLKFFMDGHLFTEEEMTVSRLEQFYKNKKSNIDIKSGDNDEVLMFLIKDVQYVRVEYRCWDRVPAVRNGNMVGWNHELREHESEIHALVLKDMSVIDIHEMGIEPISYDNVKEVI